MPTFGTADGTQLHYDETGDGTMLVTLSGGAGRRPSYLGDLAGLPGRLVIPHFRGVGESPAAASPEAGSYWRQSADLESLRAHLGLDQLDLVAHSAGTRLAVCYAAQYPDRVGRMLLITPPAAYVTDTPSDADEITGYRRGEPAFEAAVAAMNDGPGPGTSQAEFDAWLAATAPATYAAWTDKEQAHSRVGATLIETMLAFFSVAPPEDLAQRLSKTAAKVRVIAGAQDYVTGLAPVLAMAELFTNGEAVVVEDCGHYPWVEQPARFREAAETVLGSA